MCCWRSILVVRNYEASFVLVDLVGVSTFCWDAVETGIDLCVSCVLTTSNKVDDDDGCSEGTRMILDRPAWPNKPSRDFTIVNIPKYFSDR